MENKFQHGKRNIFFTKGNLTSSISILALLISMIVAIYTQVEKHSQDKRFLREEFRATIMNLLTFREDYEREKLFMDDPSEIDLAERFLVMKLNVYINAAKLISSQISDQITPAEYTILATESATIGNINESEYFFKQAIAVSKAIPDKIGSHQGLASFYFEDSPLRNFDEGRKHFEYSIELIKNPTDDNLIRIKGNSYEIWGDLELHNGFNSESLQKFNLARKYYSDLSPRSKDKQQILNGLNKKINKFNVTSQNKSEKKTKENDEEKK
jgi:hypothetical protein